MKYQCAIARFVPRALCAAALLLALAGGQVRGADLTFAPGRVTGPASTQVVLPVMVTNFSNVSLFQFSLHWNPTAAAFVGVEQFGLAGMGAANFGTSLAANGTLTVSWDDPNGLSTTVANGTVVFGVRMQLLGAAGSTSGVTIDGTPTAVEAADQNLATVPVALMPGALSVNPPDVPPSITVPPQPQTVQQGGEASFSVTAAGTAPLSYQWRFNGADMPGQTTTTLALNNVQPGQAGGYSVRVTNIAGSITSAVVNLTVVAPNTPPVIATVGNRTVNEGSLLSLTVVATDNDTPQQTLTYSIDPDPPVGMTINPTSGLLTWTPLEVHGPGTIVVTVRATDNGSPALSDTETFTILVNEVNLAPSIVTVSNRTVNEGSVLTFVVTATDPDVPVRPLTFSLDPGAPAGASINPNTGQFSWTPTEDQGPSVQTITVRVTDGGSPPLSDSTTFSVMVNEVNSAPSLPAPGNKLVMEGSLLTFNAGATDSDVPVQTLFYTLDPGAPSGAFVNALTGTFAWTPSEIQGPSTNIVTLRVTDNGSPMLSDFKTFVIVVSEVNNPPTLAAMPDKIVIEGTTVFCTNSAADPDLPAQSLTYSLGAGTPAGATINPVSGLFTWATGEPHGPSTNRITMVVTDNGLPALSATQSFTVVVLESNQPPTLLPLGDLTAQVLVPMRITNYVNDPDSPTNHITFQFLEAPKGARLNRFTGAIFWSPTRDQARTTNIFTVIAIDDGVPMLIATNTFRVTVDDFVELVLGAAVLRSGDTGSVPVQMLSTVGVTNVQTMLFAPENRLAGLNLLTVAAELRPGGLQMQSPGQAHLTFETLPGQSLVSSQLLGHVQFTAVSPQSAFVPITLSSVTARQTNGLPVPRTIPGSGRVVVVAQEPLLEALLLTNSQRRLVLYGPPGSGYTIQKTTDISRPNQWQTVWAGTLTNLFQIVPADGNSSEFYRAIRPN